jgi:hypothetical protein
MDGHETLSFILRDEQRLKMFENRVLRKIFGPEKGKVTGDWRNRSRRSFMTCSRHLMLSEIISQGG